ncbi:uncharacterized protein (DUF885 family) [Kitasatospora sp. MAA19]|nr:uncharacterized protein (DUF885 family) [Kitasatospora sp. MAA19]
MRNLHTPVHQLRSIFTMMPAAEDDDWAPVLGRLRNLPAALDGYRATLTEGIVDLKRWHMEALRQGSLGLDDLEAALAAL